jgi:hypothetical protein
MIQFKRGTTKAMSSDDLEKIIQKSITDALGEGHKFTILDLLFPTAAVADLVLDVNDKIKANMAAADGTWEKIILSNGQPGYDRRTHKLKIGDGRSTWQELPNVGGLDYDQVLDSEKKAKIRRAINPTDKTVFTYGTEPPDANIVGQVYLHQYDGDIETDYVIETGVNKGWHYRKWYSGYFECWITTTLTEDKSVNISNAIGSLFVSDNIGSLDYPVAFEEPPTEIVSVEALSFSPPTAAKDDDAADDDNTEDNAGIEDVDNTADSIIFVSSALLKDDEDRNNTTKSRHVYLTSPVALNAEVVLNIITKGIVRK